MKIRKGVLVFFSLFLLLFALSVPTYAKGKSYTPSYSKSYSRTYKYIIPRNQIQVPKTQTVKPYFKSNGTYVPSYQRAPKGSLKPYYAPGYPKSKLK